MFSQSALSTLQNRARASGLYDGGTAITRTPNHTDSPFALHLPATSFDILAAEPEPGRYWYLTAGVWPEPSRRVATVIGVGFQKFPDSSRSRAPLDRLLSLVLLTAPSLRGGNPACDNRTSFDGMSKALRRPGPKGAIMVDKRLVLSIVFGVALGVLMSVSFSWLIAGGRAATSDLSFSIGRDHGPSRLQKSHTSAAGAISLSLQLP